MPKLEGKTAIVTGAGRGLGREIALGLAAEGAQVVAFSRTEKDLHRLSSEISDQGGKCLVFPGDISNMSDVRGLVETTLKHFSGLDILVNNAAIIGPAQFNGSDAMSAWSKTIDINLNGAAHCAQAAVQAMAEKQYGKIINLASGLGQMPFPRFAAYSVSKAGIIQLTRSLAEEFKSLGIRVNAINPGVMDTPMQEEIRELGPDALGPELDHRFKAFQSQGDLKSPSQIAPLAVFLSCPESDHITGRYGNLADFRGWGWPG